MGLQEDMQRKVWDILKARKHYGDQINAVEFAKTLIELQSDVGISEYKNLIIPLLKKLGRNCDFPFIPDGFECFSRSFIEATHPSNVLIPFATGLECEWFDNESIVEYHFFNREYEQVTSLFADVIAIQKIPEAGKYDLILSALPLGRVSSRSISCQITEQSSELLADDGYCIFTFTKAITHNTAEKWLSELERKGLYCEAVIDLPAGSYAPISMVESEIVVFSKKKAERRFVALLSEENTDTIVVENFLKRKASKSNPKLGVYAEDEIRCYSDYLNRTRIQKKNKTLAKSYNGRLVMIKEIGSVHVPDKNNNFQESDNAVYVPRLGVSPVVTTIADFRINAQNYFQIVVNTDLVLPRYLAFFLNTEEGVNLRQLLYSGVIKAFNRQTISDMIIPCPSLKLQSEYLKTFDQLEVLRIEIETLKDRLQKTPASYKNIRKEINDINNNGDRFLQWIETLPYPIATILKKYSVAEDPREKQDTLFYFYEAYAIFLATILSAPLNKSTLDCSNLTDVDPAFFEKASFGNWVKMDRALTKLFSRTMSKSNDEKNAVLTCFKTSDEKLINLICNKKVCNILEKASGFRNIWKGHSGITNQELYKDHVDTLDSMLHDFHESIRDLYERIRLIRPISLTYSNGEASNKVEVLTGSNSIFLKDTIKTVFPLDDSKLYLQLLDSGEMLELPPYFILKNSPADVKNACYFYSRIEKGNTKYVSYHYDGKPEDIETGEAAFDHIKRLLTN